MNIKKTSLRKPLLENTLKDKKTLIRLYKDKTNVIQIDLKQEFSGRGCYIDYDEDLLNKIIKRKLITKALRGGNLQESLIDELKDIIRRNRNGEKR